MSYNSGINQRVKEQEFFNNTTAQDQNVNEVNGSLIANLTFVKNYFSSISSGFLPVNNPNFSGSLTSSSGGSITLSNPFSTITTPTLVASTINGISTFFSQPRISFSGSGVYPIQVRQIGELKTSVSMTAPVNYLLCDGSTVSSTTYSALFSVIGYNYGGSNGSFQLPNFSSKFPVGGNGSINNVASSNIATGNGQSGATNTQQITGNFAGGSTNSTPIIVEVPQHTHTITDNGHIHGLAFDNSQPSTITPIGVQSFTFPSNPDTLYSSTAYTGISINDTGVSIQARDPISTLAGVNITPPFIAINYFICYQ